MRTSLVSLWIAIAIFWYLFTDILYHAIKQVFCSLLATEKNIKSFHWYQIFEIIIYYICFGLRGPLPSFLEHFVWKLNIEKFSIHTVYLLPGYELHVPEPVLWLIRGQNSGHSALRNSYWCGPRRHHAVPGLHPPIRMLYLVLITSLRIHKTKIHMRNSNRRWFPFKRQNLTALFFWGGGVRISNMKNFGGIASAPLYLEGKWGGGVVPKFQSWKLEEVICQKNSGLPLLYIWHP